MKTIFQNRWLIVAIRLVLGGIFIFASIAKFVDIAGFINTVSSYGILSYNLSHVYGYIVPWVELFIGCSFILGILIRFSAVLSIPLVISFIIASSYALANAGISNCGCFGTFLTMSHPASLIIDVLMLFASLILTFNSGKDFLSIRQLFNRLNTKSRIKAGGLSLVMVGLMMAIVVGISIGVHNASRQALKITETVNVPAPLANDVNVALIKNKIVLLEFYADGCAACQEAAPLISDMEKQFISQTVFIQVDYYQNPQAVSELKVITTPTILVITGKNSEGKYNVLGRFEGTIERNALQTCIEQAINGQ